MVKEIIHSKIEYLELLIENPDGVTGSEVEEIWDACMRREKLCFDYLNKGVPSE